MRRLIAKERVGSKVRKKYDRVQTPYRRGLSASDVPKEICNMLNPVVLQRRIEENLRPGEVAPVAWVLRHHGGLDTSGTTGYTFRS